ncbi:MAG: thiol-disulfide isomerase [Ferruginibacter sp.]|nr:thiol-disulfide isomerase [Ferruginibacter sp.]
MKKILFAFAPLVIAAGLAFNIGDPLPIGSAMPKADLKMKDVSGKDISIQDVAKGKGVLVMFSCNTCPYVVKNQERTKAIASYALRNDIGVILLNSNEAQRGDDDGLDQMRKYAESQNFKWNYVVDQNSEMANAFGANRTPECYLFNKGLTLVYHGAIDDNPAEADNVHRQHLKEAISELAADKTITVKESRSVGCSIKRN